MTTEQFEQIIRRRMELGLETLAHKAKEYAKGDRLHNFKRGGEVMGCSPERALLGYMTKHLVSVVDIIDDIEKGHAPTQTYWDEKLGDLYNYVLLLDAVVTERITPK